MKQILTILALLVTSWAGAQITVSNAIFLAPGDVLERSFTTNVGAVVVSPASATAQAWDYSFLTTDMMISDSILPASDGSAYAQFPTADILGTIAGFIETYTDVTTTEMTNIGASVEFFGFQFVSPFLNTQVIQTAPLDYNTTSNDNFSVAFAAHIDSIPFLRDLIDSLITFPGVTTDSIRLRVTGNTNMLVDAFGTCVAYDSTYEVLRQRVITTTDIKIDVRATTFLGSNWQDITPLVGSQLPFPLTDTMYRYDFIAEAIKQPIVRLNMDATGTTVESAEFRGDNPVSVRWTETLKEISLYPNPAQELLQIDSKLLNGEQFQVQIIDLMGRTLLQQNNLQGDLQQISITELPQGTYYLLLRSNSGVLIAQEPFVIVR